MRSVRRWLFVVFVAVMAPLGVLAASSLATPVPLVPGPDSPSAKLTPGAHFDVGIAVICKAGYAHSVRNVPTSEKNAVYARYGLKRVAYAYEVDHLVSLEIGGSNAITNLWPEHYYDPLGAHTKDRLENKLHELVCSGRLALAVAQTQEARNWISAYRRYVGTLPASLAPSSTAPARSSVTFTAGAPTPTAVVAIPATTVSAGTTTVATTPAVTLSVTTAPVTTVTQPATSPTDPYDPDGFYASSYGSASTIYCADDSGWKGLSAAYLQHFATWAAAIAAHPTYHLHQPC
jgi:hypothetical protein